MSLPLRVKKQVYLSALQIGTPLKKQSEKSKQSSLKIKIVHQSISPEKDSPQN